MVVLGDLTDPGEADLTPHLVPFVLWEERRRNLGLQTGSGLSGVWVSRGSTGTAVPPRRCRCNPGLSRDASALTPRREQPLAGGAPLPWWRVLLYGAVVAHVCLGEFYLSGLQPRADMNRLEETW